MAPQDSTQALSAPLDGNRRYASGAGHHPRQSAYRRAEVVGGQRPFAVIIGCSDSRVPPEIIFDCGLGDLFVIRVAGNVLDDVVLGSVEYAVEHLGVGLVMVLGHSHCGAVTASARPSSGRRLRVGTWLTPRSPPTSNWPWLSSARPSPSWRA